MPETLRCPFESTYSCEGAFPGEAGSVARDVARDAATVEGMSEPVMRTGNSASAWVGAG
jgi:hypothetical protein